MAKISNYAGLGAEQVDPLVTSLVLCILVVRQYGHVVSATASDHDDNRSVYILDNQNMPRVKKSANLFICKNASRVTSYVSEIKDA